MLAWFLFAVVVVGWGSTFLGIRVGLEGFTVLGLVSARNLLAAGAALLLARVRGEAPVPRSEWLRQASLGLLLVLAGNTLTAAAQQYLSTGLTGLLNATISLWIVLLASRTEVMPRRVWVGVGLGLLGVALLLLPGDRIRVHPAGFLLMMGSTLSFSIGALVQRKRPSAGGIFGVLAIQMGTSGLVAGGLASVGSGFVHGPLGGSVLGSLVFLAAVPSLAAYAAFATLSRLWPPSRFGIYAVLTPLVAVGLGSLALREPLTLRMVLAMGITLGGVALAQRR